VLVVLAVLVPASVWPWPWPCPASPLAGGVVVVWVVPSVPAGAVVVVVVAEASLLICLVHPKD
jgi:hypothetical protein